MRRVGWREGDREIRKDALVGRSAPAAQHPAVARTAGNTRATGTRRGTRSRHNGHTCRPTGAVSSGAVQGHERRFVAEQVHSLPLARADTGRRRSGSAALAARAGNARPRVFPPAWA
jgi:hypothetical protein